MHAGSELDCVMGKNNDASVQDSKGERGRQGQITCMCVHMRVLSSCVATTVKYPETCISRPARYLPQKVPLCVGHTRLAAVGQLPFGAQ